MKQVLTIFAISLLCISNSSAQKALVKSPQGTESAYPFWSPDGTFFVYQSNQTGNWNLFKKHIKSNSVIQLTFDTTNQITPSISPDGNWIAYVSDEDGDNEIFIMDISGLYPKQITSNTSEDIHPFWHPTENKLLFNSTRDNPDSFELYALNLNTKIAERLTDNDISETYASWSPDGTRICFIRWDDDSGNLFLMNVIDKSEVQLTEHEGFDGWPTWLNNNEIVFASFRVDPAQIFKINILNGKLKQLTSNRNENVRPNVWNYKLLYNGKNKQTMHIYMKNLNY